MVATSTNNSFHKMVTGVLIPLVAFVSWFGLSAYLLSKHASPLMELL